MEKGTLTVGANADVTPRVMHTGPFTPLPRYRIEAPNRAEVLVTVEPADHVDQIVQRAQAVVGSRRGVRAH